MIDYIRIIEMQTLAEHITYLRGKSSNGNNDELIKAAKEAHERIASQVGKVGEE